MQTATGEIDVRQLDFIVRRWNALARRPAFSATPESSVVIQSLCDDMTTLLVAFGCDIEPPGRREEKR